jgi:hypothetical protein
VTREKAALREASAIAFIRAVELEMCYLTLHFTESRFCWASILDPIRARPDFWMLEFLAAYQPELKKLLLCRTKENQETLEEWRKE